MGEKPNPPKLLKKNHLLLKVTIFNKQLNVSENLTLTTEILFV